MSVLAAEQVVNELPMPPAAFALLAIAAFAALLAVTFAFRSVAHRQGPPRGPGSAGQGAAGHGSGGHDTGH